MALRVAAALALIVGAQGSSQLQKHVRLDRVGAAQPELPKGFVRALEFKHSLRVCNASPDTSGMSVRRGEEQLTGETPMPYKSCRDFSAALFAGDRIEFKIGETTTGTFSESDLPNSDAVLLLVIHRHDTENTVVAFASYVFANTDAAQVAMLSLAVLPSAVARALADDVWEPAREILAAYPLQRMAFLAGDGSGRRFTFEKGGMKMSNHLMMASSSKFPAAFAVVGAAAAGNLSFETHPHEVFPWRTSDPADRRSRVPLRHLLSFTSCFWAPAAGGAVPCLQQFQSTPYTAEACAKEIYEQASFEYEPDSTWAYNSFHPQVAAAMVAKVSNISVSDLLQRNLIRRLNLPGTIRAGGQNPQLAGNMVTTGDDCDEILRAYVNCHLVPKTVADEMGRDYLEPPVQDGVASVPTGSGLAFVRAGGTVGSRLYLTDGADSYRLFGLLNREFTFGVDVCSLACGMSGETDVDGQRGICCFDMDIWEANTRAAAFTTHPCTVEAPTLVGAWSAATEIRATLPRGVRRGRVRHELLSHGRAVAGGPRVLRGVPARQ